MPRIRVIALCCLLLALGGVGASEDVFSWRQCEGQSLRIMLSRHPSAEGIRRKLREFESLTGIRVVFSMHPEERYFPALDRAFSSASSKPDVFMIGLYQVWEYAGRGRMLPLDPMLSEASLTRSGYDSGDFFPAIAGAFRWNGKAGAALGEGTLWAIPIGFEAASLVYNREVLAKFRLPVPRTMEGLVEAGRRLNGFEGEGTYGVAARGLGEWNSLHSGYITAFTNFGAVDMEVEGGRLVSRVNSPEAVAATELWIAMLRDCGPEEWEYYDWYRCLDDVGSRKAAFLFDSDILGYYANSEGVSSQSGKLGIAPPPVPEGDEGVEVGTNLWAWGLGINPESENTRAAWLFVQYFTGREFQLYSVLEWKSLNPPRRSVFEDPVFQEKILSMEGYGAVFESVVLGGRVVFTPNPYFSDISQRWAAVIRDIANGMYDSTQEGMDSLKVWMDGKLSKVPVD